MDCLQRCATLMACWLWLGLSCTLGCALAQTPFVSVSAASYQSAALAPEAIVAGFGSGLATTTQVATTLPLPTTLGGTTVSVRDSAGVTRNAPLFFVSATQINYLLPPDTAHGAATVTVRNSQNQTSAGTIPKHRRRVMPDGDVKDCPRIAGKVDNRKGVIVPARHVNGGS